MEYVFFIAIVEAQTGRYLVRIRTRRKHYSMVDHHSTQWHQQAGSQSHPSWGMFSVIRRQVRPTALRYSSPELPCSTRPPYASSTPLRGILPSDVDRPYFFYTKLSRMNVAASAITQFRLIEGCWFSSVRFNVSLIGSTWRCRCRLQSILFQWKFCSDVTASPIHQRHLQMVGLPFITGTYVNDIILHLWLNVDTRGEHDVPVQDRLFILWILSKALAKWDGLVGRCMCMIFTCPKSSLGCPEISEFWNFLGCLSMKSAFFTA